MIDYIQPEVGKLVDVLNQYGQIAWGNLLGN